MKENERKSHFSYCIDFHVVRSYLEYSFLDAKFVHSIIQNTKHIYIRYNIYVCLYLPNHENCENKKKEKSIENGNCVSLFFYAIDHKLNRCIFLFSFHVYKKDFFYFMKTISHLFIHIIYVCIFIFRKCLDVKCSVIPEISSLSFFNIHFNY